ncbi:unnamed protein product [Coccothraustes coccothraustes]
MHWLCVRRETLLLGLSFPKPGSTLHSLPPTALGQRTPETPREKSTDRTRNFTVPRASILLHALKLFRTEPGPTEPSLAEPSRAQPNGAELSRTEPSASDVSRTEPSSAEAMEPRGAELTSSADLGRVQPSRARERQPPHCCERRTRGACGACRDSAAVPGG